MPCRVRLLGEGAMNIVFLLCDAIVLRIPKRPGRACTVSGAWHSCVARHFPTIRNFDVLVNPSTASMLLDAVRESRDACRQADDVCFSKHEHIWCQASFISALMYRLMANVRLGASSIFGYIALKPKVGYAFLPGFLPVVARRKAKEGKPISSAYTPMRLIAALSSGASTDLSLLLEDLLEEQRNMAINTLRVILLPSPTAPTTQQAQLSAADMNYADIAASLASFMLDSPFKEAFARLETLMQVLCALLNFHGLTDVLGTLYTPSHQETLLASRLERLLEASHACKDEALLQDFLLFKTFNDVSFLFEVLFVPGPVILSFKLLDVDLKDVGVYKSKWEAQLSAYLNKT